MEETTRSASLSNITQPRHRFSVSDVQEDIEDEIMHHFNDPNWDFQDNSSSLSTSEFSTHIGAGSEVDRATQNSDANFSSEATQVQDSPYPEVRAAVANTDDPTMIVNTFRVWIIGLVLSSFISSFNTVVNLRFPSIWISPLFAQVVSLLMGKLLEWILPRYRVSVFGYSFSLNPGPFNIKEHALITIMTDVAASGSLITDISGAERILHDERWPISKQFLLGLAFQLLGFFFAGTLRQYLVWPTNMIWPGALARCALLNAMHSNYGKRETNHISRERFLHLAIFCSFVWYWVPGYLWTGLSVFNWVCWIAPNNVVVNSVFGSTSGFGMGLMTFDWAQVAEGGNPLVTPWWSQLNMFGGFLIVIWVICPILWAKNVFYSQFMPVSVSLSFDNTGNQYNLSAIVTNNAFDQAKYEQYSPMFLPITFIFAYGANFAINPAVLVHTFLWYRHDTVRQFRRTLKDETDIHAYLMRKYPEVPHWWFLTLGFLCLVLGIVTIEIYKIAFPIWAFVFGILFAAVFVLPFGIIQAMTNQQFYQAVLSEVIIGYILPGRPIYSMIFKTVATDAATEAVSYCGSLKFGHYMKIPPRPIFLGQILSSVVMLISSIVSQEWALGHIPDICTSDQKDFFTCPSLKIFSTASIIWGGIGPKRLYSHGSLYYPILWFFLIGAFLPIPFYYIARRRPRSFWRYVNIPLVICGPCTFPLMTGQNFASSIMVGGFFQWYIRRFHLNWWMRYDYILATGLDAGVIFGLVAIFFILQLPKGGINLNWWGNEAWKNTADVKMTPLKTLAPGQTFGPTTWS